MPDRSSKKRPADLNQLARSIVDAATGEREPEDQRQDAQPEKNPAAVSLGRLGGKKGGQARAKKLSAEQRREIARKGAAKRWGKRGA